MSDYRSRQFRALLTTTMDTLLRTAVFEISKVFDCSVHDHQVELVQKTEEITRLQRRLLRAEGKLRDGRGGVGRHPEETITIEDDEEPIISDVDIPEVVFEVPDDWCAPFAPDAPDEVQVVIQEDNECPSVSLRPLSVALWRIPTIKQEVEDDDFESHLLTSLKESPMNSSLPQKRRSRKLKHSQSLKLPTRLRRSTDRELRSNRVENLDHDSKKYRSDLPANVNDGKSPVARNAGKKTKGSATETSSGHVKGEEKPSKSSQKIYSCKFCSKVFNKEFGLSVHLRSHKKCTICHKTFPFPSSLRIHSQYCRKVKDERSPKKEKSAQNLESPNKDDATISGKASSKIGFRQLTCRDCGMKFPNLYALRIHKERIHKEHKNEDHFDCNMCTQKFPRKSLLKKHLYKVHKRKQKYGETNGDLSWMKPLEDTVDTQVASSASQQIQIPPTENKDIQLARNPKPKKLKIKSKDWKTLGKEVPDGFCCSQCKKVLSSKYLLIEHYRIHTGERPLSCDRCDETFRCHSLRSLHRKKCTGDLVPCQLCGKVFLTEPMCNKHIMDAHKCWPHVCEQCGKGFVNSKCLRNHCERLHI